MHDKRLMHQRGDADGWSVATREGSRSSGTGWDAASEQYQLQVWAYETSGKSLTLAEKLERTRWEQKAGSRAMRKKGE